ncbi:hypothetical protein HWN40_08580 [Methanolobus zinderi]|uniref:Uncharacterized protein n=1 Tax=Methanolobus zinderi TaxID=536044 RepID=A0A7D5E6X3_9EURY|nr:hypothetical protein [Methanolobus zinderi]QLC50292.1 hypothetical protein HWN40_08580 [Methanolobus zinderi]
MKRLTISMSDELFSKLESVENKSLFIRKLIERELDMLDSISDIDSNTPWERDIASLKGNIDELFTRLSDMEAQLNSSLMQDIPKPETIPETDLSGAGEQAAVSGRDNQELQETLSTEQSSTPATPYIINENQEPELPITEEPEISEKVQEDAKPFLTHAEVPADAQAENWTQPLADNTELTPAVETIPEKNTPDIATINQQTPEPESPAIQNQQQEPIFKLPELETDTENHEDSGFKLPDMGPDIETQQENTFKTPEFEETEESHHNTGTQIPDLKPQKEALQENTFSVPDVGPRQEEQQKWTMPDLKPSPDAQQIAETAKMPDPEPPVETHQEPGFVMPELKPPAENKQNQETVVPEIDTSKAQQEPAFSMPELKAPMEEKSDQGMAMPDLKPPTEPQSEPPFTMPDLKTPGTDQQEPPFQIPDLKPPAEVTGNEAAGMPGMEPPFENTGEESFAMPDLSSPEPDAQTPPFMSETKPPFENNDQGFAIPDLKPPEGMEEATSPGIPDLQQTAAPPFETMQQGQPEEKQPLFKIHNIDSDQPDDEQPPFVAPAFPESQPQENAQLPPFENPGQDINPPAAQPPTQPVNEKPPAPPTGNSSLKPDKLGSNILMYMPHGAKVKKDIIKSLISKQFTENEIEAKLSEMISAGVLKLSEENGNSYLIRP